MPHQVALTVRATLRAGEAEGLKQWLTELQFEPTRRRELFPFEQLPVHFARLVVLDEAVDLEGAPLPASVVFMSDADAPFRRYLRDLSRVAGPGLDAVFNRCEGYPASPGPGERVEYLQARSLPTATNYVNHVGRSVQQIRDEARLRGAIEDFLDRRDWAAKTAEDVREAVKAYVASEPDLSWALEPPRRPSLAWRIGDVVNLVGVGAITLLLLPFLLVVLPFWLVAIRILEARDRAETRAPDQAHLDQLAGMEERAAQNPMSAVGFRKLGSVRRITVVVALFVVNWGARHLYRRGSLAGIKTIHFARWVFLDDKRRLIFVSNYDGTRESYMDDFIDKIAWSLNLVFSNGVGFPRTRWLLFGGAHDEQAFKNYLRINMIPTQLWYSAYPALTALNIADNAAIRAGLSSPAEDATTWARRL